MCHGGGDVQKCRSCHTGKKKLAQCSGTPAFTSVKTALNLAVFDEESSGCHFETLNLFQNAYFSCVYYKCLEYIADEDAEKLKEGTNQTLTWLDCWTMIVVLCFAEQEIKDKHSQKRCNPTFGAVLTFALA